MLHNQIKVLESYNSLWDIKEGIQECLALLDEADKELSRGTGDGLQHLAKVKTHALIDLQDLHPKDSLFPKTDALFRATSEMVVSAENHSKNGNAIEAKTEVSMAQRILVKAIETIDKEFKQS